MLQSILGDGWAKQSSERNLCHPKHSYIFHDFKEGLWWELNSALCTTSTIKLSFLAPRLSPFLFLGLWRLWNSQLQFAFAADAGRRGCTSGPISSAISMQGTRSLGWNGCWRGRSIFWFLAHRSSAWRHLDVAIVSSDLKGDWLVRSSDLSVHCTAIACHPPGRSFSPLPLSLREGLAGGSSWIFSNAFFHDGIKQDLLL